jgi:transposase-like protein
MRVPRQGGNMAKHSVLKCPICDSADLYYENAMITGVVYHCKKCDYVGSFVVEKDYDEDDIEEEKKKK